MDSSRFDRLAMRLGARLSRRQAIGAAGLSAFALAARVPLLAAQDATPEASPGEGPNLPPFLFVQLADSGTWEPKPGEEGVYLLTLRGTGDQTLYFSDRPERLVGTMDTDRFLDALGFTPVDPPTRRLSWRRRRERATCWWSSSSIRFTPARLERMARRR